MVTSYPDLLTNTLLVKSLELLRAVLHRLLVLIKTLTNVKEPVNVLLYLYGKDYMMLSLIILITLLCKIFLICKKTGHPTII